MASKGFTHRGWCRGPYAGLSSAGRATRKNLTQSLLKLCRLLEYVWQEVTRPQEADGINNTLLSSVLYKLCGSQEVKLNTKGVKNGYEKTQRIHAD